jgi:hypothetical protein
MRMYKVASGDKLEGSIIDEDYMSQLIAAKFFAEGTEIDDPADYHKHYVVRGDTLQTWNKGSIILPLEKRRKYRKYIFGVPTDRHLTYHQINLPEFQETLDFKDAPKWLKRACARITFHWQDTKKKPHKHVFEPYHFAYELKAIGDEPAHLSCVRTWAWNDDCRKNFDRFDEDQEEATVGTNSSEHEKQRHKLIYQAKKGRGV